MSGGASTVLLSPLIVSATMGPPYILASGPVCIPARPRILPRFRPVPFSRLRDVLFAIAHFCMQLPDSSA
jgi:hypothetical protein